MSTSHPGAVSWKPSGFHSLTPSLAIEGAVKAIDFYKAAFGAETVGEIVMDGTGGKVMHAEVKIGDSIFFVSDVFPQMGCPPSVAQFWIYHPQVDQLYKRAIAAGATSKMAPMDQFWGDRMGSVMDPYGQQWSLATHIKDMTKEEIKQAQQEFMKKRKEECPSNAQP